VIAIEVFEDRDAAIRFMPELFAKMNAARLKYFVIAREIIALQK